MRRKEIKRRLLKEGITFSGVEYEIEEMLCPVCRGSFIHIVIDGEVVYGGYGVTEDYECCIKCWAERLNKLLEEGIRR